MEILGSQALMERVRNEGLCTACGACVHVCPYHQSYLGKIALTFDCDLEQGQCYAHCPKTETDFDALSQTLFDEPYQNTSLGHFKSIVTAQAGQQIGSSNFQNGGTVSALMIAALDQGLISAAVLTGQDGIMPVPKWVKNSQEVLECSTTKYMATPTLSALNQAIKKGEKRLGVVGTACQMRAVATMRQNPLVKKDYENAISLSLGVFCTWALDTRQFLDFLVKKVALDKVISMDVPPPPAEVLIVKTSDGDISIPLSEIRPLIPKGCSTCPDMTAEWADVSVGAFEGKPNWNTLVIRSQKGEQLVKMAVAEGYLVLDEFPAESLAHLTLGAGNKKKRAE